MKHEAHVCKQQLALKNHKIFTNFNNSIMSQNISINKSTKINQKKKW